MGRKKILIFYAVLGLAIMQYQNCAPANQSLDDSIHQESPGTDGLNDGIDQVRTGEISFQQSKVSAFAQDELTVYGVCEGSGALIGWKLLDIEENVIDRGLAKCDLGVFEVPLDDKWKSYCDEDLVLKAALGVASKSQTIIETLCD